MKNALTALLIFLWISVSFAQEVIPGLIPRFYSIEAATDLPIPSELAHTQALAGLDLSILDPDKTTNLWKPESNQIPNYNLIQSLENVTFVKELPSRVGQVRFTIKKASGQELIIVLSKKVHNFLLRRNILSKLGYNTQPMSWVSQVNLRFNNTIDRDLLKETMKDKLFAGPERWIKSEDDLEIILQDALVLTPESEIYNLALGLMPESVHQGRRLLRAPYVPLALVDATESINLMSWQAGRIVLNNIKLYHTQDLDSSYGASWEDARWIGRRLGQLSRNDFEEIVQKAYFPKAVELLLIEKILSRRNDLMRLLNLPQSLDIPFNPSVGYGNDLIDGEITQEFFEGYSSRFSYGDPESPFSASELGHFALSRLQSQIIDSAITKFNTFLGSQDEENYAQKISEIIEKQGPFFSYQAVVVPTFHGGFVLSRDIVTGSYLGTNNKVQLVDNFGVTLDAGVFAGIEGGAVPLGIKGGGGINLQRIYSHVKPVQSLKKSMKEPYKNLLVPLVMRKLAKKIDKLSSVSGEDQTIMMNSVVNDLKNSLAIGESFIITDSLVPRLFGEMDLSLSQFFFVEPNALKLYTKIQAERMMLTRFHFHRASENTFHIYQDYGHNTKFQITLKLKSYVPIVNFNARWSNAKAETHFYPVSLHPRDVTVEILKALRRSILSLKHDTLQEIVRPHLIDHDVNGKGSTWQFLIFKRNKTGTEQTLGLTHAQGGERQIHRRYDAITVGTDFESYATEAINQILGLFTQTELSVSASPTSNPGFSLGGKARNRIFTSETDGERMTTVFQRIFNGWKVKPKKLQRILTRLNAEAGEEVFNPLSVMNTDSILLYQIQFLYTLTQEGVDELLTTSPERLAHVLKNYGQHELNEDALQNQVQSWHHHLEVITLRLKEDPTNGMKKFHSWLKSFQDSVTIKGLEILVGKENIAWQGRIDGFRQGDEAGDSSIFSHVYGELPIPLQTSPTQAVMQSWGILEGELLLNWMTERAL